MKNDSLSRRHFVRRAAKSFLGVSALGSLPAGLTQAAGKDASALRQIASAKRVIYLYMSGGMSHLDTFDPKPGGEAMGPTRQVRTKVDGLVVSDYLPLLARQSDKLAIINSMNSTQGAHKQGNYYMHTSYEMRSSIRHPAMGAWMLRLLGKDNPTLPANVMIGNDSNHPGSGFLESSMAPLVINDPKEGLRNSKRPTDFSEKQFNTHLELARKLDAPFVERYDQKNVRAYSAMYEDAIRLMNSADLKAFDLSKEPAALKSRYGNHNFGQGVLLARRLLEHGVQFVEVALGGWDTHNSNFVNLPENAGMLDEAMSTLLVDLERRGMLHDTLVVLATEFGRTPEINANEGRDHHPQAFSCVLAGGGIRGGQVYGKTDENGSKVLENPVKIPDLNATIGYALGMPLDQIVFSPSMRPFTAADKGKPIVSLFS